MKFKFYLKKQFTNVLMLHVNEKKNKEMDKLVRLTVYLSQQPISHDGQRKCLKEEGTIKERNYKSFHWIFFQPFSTGNSQT